MTDDTRSHDPKVPISSETIKFKSVRLIFTLFFSRYCQLILTTFLERWCFKIEAILYCNPILLFTVSNALVNHLASVIEDNQQIAEHRLENLNAVKMTCYLLCQYMEMLEVEDTKPSATQVINAKVSSFTERNCSPW